MSSLAVGVIGAGNMGADHARTLHRFVSGADVRAVADLDRGRAEAVADDLGGARATDDARALIDDPGVEAVVIASHDSTHAELTVRAIRAGKAVLCEKPLAPDLDEAVGVLEQIGPGGEALLSLGFMRRFDPGYVQLRDELRRGVIGAPLLAHCVSRGVASYPGTTSEMAVTASAVHEFDLLPWLLGSPVVEVTWTAPRASSLVVGMQDPQLLTARTADGVLSTVEVFLNARYGYDIRCEVVGETGALSLTEPLRTAVDQAGQRSVGYPADWRPRFADAYRLELQAWVDATRAGARSPLASGRDGVTASAVADAALTSMRDGGRTVPVPTLQADQDR